MNTPDARLEESVWLWTHSPSAILGFGAAGVMTNCAKDRGIEGRLLQPLTEDFLTQHNALPQATHPAYGVTCYLLQPCLLVNLAINNINIQNSL